MTHQDIAHLPIGSIVHTSYEGRACREDVLSGHANPATGRFATFAPLWGGGGSKPIEDWDLPYLHSPEDCQNPHGAQETSRSVIAKRVA